MRIEETELPETLSNPSTPQIEAGHFAGIACDRLLSSAISTDAPRILILDGSLRARSFSRLSAGKGGRSLTWLGGEGRIVGVMVEFIKFTFQIRDCAGYLVDRHSGRKESAAQLSARVKQSAI